MDEDTLVWGAHAHLSQGVDGHFVRQLSGRVSYPFLPLANIPIYLDVT